MLDPVDQQEQQVRSQTHCKHIDWRVDVPAKPLGELLEHDDRRIARTDKEHIHIALKSKLNNAVQHERDAAQRNKGPGCSFVVALLGTAALRHTKEQSHKDQQHMPYTGMNGQKQMSVEQSRRLCKGNGSAKQVVQHHKAVHGSLGFAGLEPGSNQAHIHGDAAQLERELAPVVCVVCDHKVAEELLKHFG